MSHAYTVEPGKNISLKDFDTRATGGLDKDEALPIIQDHVEALDPLIYRLYAEKRRALLVILQGMDTAGKDGAIRKVMSTVSPLCVQVKAFGTPSEFELQHDFLWRIHAAVPPHGMLGIFNRSQYEDVLIVRVKGLVPEKQWQRRYDQINDFEKSLVENGTTILKFFLHISKDEQRERLQQRLDDPNKRWKFRLGDLDDRRLWDDYQAAYEDALTKCNTAHAPWHIVPADRKWYRDYVISSVLRKTLEDMNPQFPQADPALKHLKVE